MHIWSISCLGLLSTLWYLLTSSFGYSQQTCLQMVDSKLPKANGDALGMAAWDHSGYRHDGTCTPLSTSQAATSMTNLTQLASPISPAASSFLPLPTPAVRNRIRSAIGPFGNERNVKRHAAGKSPRVHKTVTSGTDPRVWWEIVA